jgi:hypothetical protein
MATRTQELTFSIPVPRGRQRFRELIVYIAERYQEAVYFGTAKLSKTLYYADFRAFERFGIPLTGMTYCALKQGPAPEALLPVRGDLMKEGAIKIEKRVVGNDVEHRVVSLRPAFLDLFTGDELALVDSVIKELRDQTADDVADPSHDVRWRTVKLGDRIPYEAAYLSDAALTEDDLKRTRELADEHRWR